jgi:hypothetical protein
MGDISIILYKRILVKKQFNTLSCRQFVINMMFINSCLSATLKQFTVDLLPPLLKRSSTIISSAEHSQDLWSNALRDPFG